MRVEWKQLSAFAIAQLDPLEDDWKDWVIARAKENGWLVVHFRKAASAKGFRTPVQGDKGSPDLLMARAGDVLLPELKRNKTHPDRDQRAWLAALGPYGVVWRPTDADRIIERLKRPESVRATSAGKRTYSSCSSLTDAHSGTERPSERDTSTPTERADR